MKNLIVVVAAAAALVCLSGALEACPASYVKGIGQQNSNNPNVGKASQVTDKYMEAKGVSPDSPAGQTIKPYILGTTIVDDQWGIHRLAGKSIDQAVQDCMGCSHHRQHYDDAQREAGSQPAQILTVKQGG